MNWLINVVCRLVLSVGLVLLGVVLCLLVMLGIIIHLPVWILTGRHATVIALDAVDVTGKWIINNFGG